MTLAEQLFYMMQKNADAMQLTDLVTGIVTNADPLEITINTAMEPLKEPVLLLTESVAEKKIPVLQHSHTYADGLTGDGLAESNIVCREHGENLPVKNGYIILNRALELGDKVLLLRVKHGQKFIVLSRVFEP